jgi:hypothetical protein
VAKDSIPKTVVKDGMGKQISALEANKYFQREVFRTRVPEKCPKNGIIGNFPHPSPLAGKTSCKRASPVRGERGMVDAKLAVDNA